MVGTLIVRSARHAALALLIAGCAANSPTPTVRPSPPSTTPLFPTPSSATSSASPSAPPSASPATLEPTWVVQNSLQSGTEIVLYAADGTKLYSVTDNPEIVNPTNPDWSPTGDRLTFGATDAGGHDDLWVVNVDGSDSRVAFDCDDPCEYIDDPAWSPDGSLIAVCRTMSSGGDDRNSLVSINVATRASTTIWESSNDDFCAGPRWSPDGRAIVLEIVHVEAADPISGVTLTVLDVRTGESLVELTKPELYAATADWDRSTDLIVYSALAEPNSDVAVLFTIKPDGTDRRQVTDVPGGEAIEPSFDTSGASVVFVRAGSTLRVELSSGVVNQAFEHAVGGHHPRSRPTAAP